MGSCALRDWMFGLALALALGLAPWAPPAAHAAPVPTEALTPCVEAARDRLFAAAARGAASLTSVLDEDAPEGSLHALVLDVRPGPHPKASDVLVATRGGQPVVGQTGTLGALALRIKAVKQGYAIAAVEAAPEVARLAGPLVKLHGPGAESVGGGAYYAMPWDLPESALGGFGVARDVAERVMEDINKKGIPWRFAEPDYVIKRVKATRSEDGHGWVPLATPDDLLHPAFVHVLDLEQTTSRAASPYVTFALADSPVSDMSYVWRKRGAA